LDDLAADAAGVAADEERHDVGDGRCASSALQPGRDGIDRDVVYISARTVEWHLRKVLTKLGISSRKGLHEALPIRARGTAPA
jgi:hypothetical protein